MDAVADIIAVYQEENNEGKEDIQRTNNFPLVMQKDKREDK